MGLSIIAHKNSFEYRGPIRNLPVLKNITVLADISFRFFLH